MAELRKDPILDRWVVISSDRKNRPLDFQEDKATRDAKNCPFCKGNESTTPPEKFALRPKTSVSDPKEWTLRVVPNKFAALSDTGRLNRFESGMFKKMDGVGCHEVLIESPDHNASLEELTLSSIADCFRTFKKRILSLEKNVRIEYVQIFKNHGKAAGATLAHSHCQIIALPLIPEVIRQEWLASHQYYEKNQRCQFCDLLDQEKKARQRIVGENEHFLSFCPFAPRFPFETWIFPKFHASSFETLAEFESFASIYKETALRIRKALHNPPYNFMLHTAPVREGASKHFHWHLEILPKITRIAGFELSTGYYINYISPEDAAKTLYNTLL